MTKEPETTFDAKRYLSELWRHIPQNGWSSPHSAQVPKLDSAPVTWADHEAAEAEARLQAEARIENGPDDSQMSVLQDDDGEDYYQTADVSELRSWAMDVELDSLVWEYVAQQMLDFKFPDEAKRVRAIYAKRTKKKAA
jgi:hypothetical protein